jgi:hypothetical protein
MAKTAPKTEGKKRGRPPKAKPEGEATAPPKAAKPQPKVWNSELDEEEKALFLNHMPKIRALKEALNTANSNLRNAYKSAKAQGGFEKADFDYAFELETAEKEAKARAKIARNLKIAKIVGSDLGAQLDMFLEPTRVPAADRAYEEGRTDAMQNVAAKPKYDPSTEQYRKYMEGFHSVSESRIKDGIKVKNPAVKEDIEARAKDKAKTDQQKAVDAQAFEQAEEPVTAKPTAAPSSGTPMTRAQFRAQQEAAKASGG